MNAITANDIEKLTNALLQFRDERDWAQFHNPKDLALAISIEASELLELFLWKDAASADISKIREELADILAYVLLLAKVYDFNIADIVLEKIKKNAEKYPIDKAKGSSRKYNEL